jgi:hypothetical protein
MKLRTVAIALTMASAIIIFRYLERPTRDRPQIASNHPSERDGGYREHLLATAREELIRADQKAKILLTGIGLFIAGGVAVISGQHVAFSKLTWYISVPTWLAIGSSALAAALVGAVIYPRVRSGPRNRLVNHFGDVVKFKTEADLERALVGSVQASLTSQLLSVSQIAWRKYRLLKLGILLFLVAVFSAGSAVVLTLTTGTG